MTQEKPPRRNRPYTPEELAVIRNNRNKTPAQIGQMIGRSLCAVRSKARVMGVRLRTGSFQAMPPRYLILEIASQEAERCGVSLDLLLSECRTKEAAFARMWVCKRLSGHGYGQSSIARGLGLHPSTVHNALNRDIPRDISDYRYANQKAALMPRKAA